MPRRVQRLRACPGQVANRPDNELAERKKSVHADYNKCQNQGKAARDTAATEAWPEQLIALVEMKMEFNKEEQEVQEGERQRDVTTNQSRLLADLHYGSGLCLVSDDAQETWVPCSRLPS